MPAPPSETAEFLWRHMTENDEKMEKWRKHLEEVFVTPLFERFFDNLVEVPGERPDAWCRVFFWDPYDDGGGAALAAYRYGSCPFIKDRSTP